MLKQFYYKKYDCFTFNNKNEVYLGYSKIQISIKDATTGASTDESHRIFECQPKYVFVCSSFTVRNFIIKYNSI